MVTKRVFLAIAHNAFREAVAEVLNGEPDFEVVAQAGSLSEVGDVELEHHKLDIALVDPSLPEGERLVIVREVSKRDGANAVVLVSLSGDTKISMVEQALEAGAVGVISTSSSLKEVVEALRRIAARRG